MPKELEFRQNRSLINANFQGYKLSLDPVAVIKQELSTPPLKAKLSEDQYSYLHVELFSLHNWLVQDNWNPDCSYFINELGEVVKSSYDQESGKANPLVTVYKLNTDNFTNRKPGNYPVGFQFISESLCVLCDGIDEVILLETGSRLNALQWKEIYKHKVTEFQDFVIKDARFDVCDEKKTINLLLQHIEAQETSGHVNKLIHCTISQVAEDCSWEFKIKNELISKGSLNYSAFEYGCQAVVLCTNKAIKFKVNETVNEERDSADDSKFEKEVDGEQTQLSSYSWSQTELDVIMKFNRNVVDEKDFKVVSTKTKLTVWSANSVIFEGTLFDKIDSELTTWTWANDYLEIVLVKQEESLHWPYITIGGPTETIEDTNQDIVHPISDKPIVDLESQIEECDFPSNPMDDNYTIVRINLNSKEITHKINIGKSPPLFSICLEANEPPAIVIRDDVDACVWSMFRSKMSADENDWQIRHEGNLHAFGYIQASKQQKKFTNCSKNLQYAVICETFRHVFIYKMNYGGDNQLRNRNGPQVQIGKQHVVTLDDNGEVLGLSISNTFSALLTEKYFLYLQIN